MGVSLFLILDRKWKKEKNLLRAAVYFDIQLILNVLWSVTFFTWHSPFWAYVDIAALWFMIILTANTFYKINKTAGLLFIPYILWVSFASFLNLGVYLLNR